MVLIKSIERKELSTKRLILRDVLNSDKDSLFILYSDIESSLLDDWIPMKSIEEAEEKINQMRIEFKEKEGISFIIVNKNTNEFIGCCGLFAFDEDSSNCSLYYQIEKNHRNNGFATEAIEQLTTYCFEELKIHRIYAYITPGNNPSIKVLEKNGYKNEGLLREMEYYKGQYWDGIVMAIIESDYNIKESKSV